MQSTVGIHGIMEEGKEPSLKITHKSKPIQVRLLHFLSFLVIAGLLSFLSSIYVTRYIGAQNAVTVAPSRILPPCVPEPKSLESWIRPPSSTLLHLMNDSELFWRASFVPKIKDYPFERIPKIAFTFLARGPLPLAPLWEGFFNGSEELYSIYIHSSLLSYKPDFPPSSVFYGRQFLVSRSNGHQLVCVMPKDGFLLMPCLTSQTSGLSSYLNHAFHFTNLGLSMAISQYPISGLWAPLMKKAFMEEDVRYNKSMSQVINITEWRKGYQWFEVNRKLAVDMIKDTIYYPMFEKFCRG